MTDLSALKRLRGNPALFELLPVALVLLLAIQVVGFIGRGVTTALGSATARDVILEGSTDSKPDKEFSDVVSPDSRSIFI